MAKLDNPAGRLHELLNAYNAEATGGLNVLGTWARVFGMEGEAAGLVKLTAVAGLIDEVEGALVRTNDPDQLALFAQFGPMWAQNIIRPTFDIMQQPSANLLIDAGALAVLGGTASFLSAVASEGVVPAAAEVLSLHQLVTSLIDEIVYDETLPEEFKRLALEHAYRLAHALDDFRIGGPGAVKAATERLLGALVLAKPEVQEAVKASRVPEVFGTAWTAVTKWGPDLVKALNTYATLFQLPGSPDQ